jgi:hypothetical protein
MIFVGLASIANSYRAMSNDLRHAATKLEQPDVRRAYLVLAELWSRAAMRADGFAATIDQSILEAIE